MLPRSALGYARHVTPETWDRLRAAFNHALDLPAGQRRTWLAEHVTDEAARDDVLAMLAAHEEDPAFLEPGVAPKPTRAGPYLLGACVGTGGMGAVYRAVRDDGQYRKAVAVKLVRADPTGQILDRFLAERKILASLEHPYIASLIDGGVTDRGRPYLVMEFVADGVPIDEWCRDRPVRARLELFRQVCQAVSHAHGRLVVHRDLKPSNILVAPDGTPRLLDFGVAKVTDPVAAKITVADTHSALLPLSLVCASPEQVRGEDITTATDVYALGVLLYLLVAGRPPYDLSGLALPDVLRTICDEMPPPPSAWRPLDADLDSIALKALRKDAAERYPSVDALSDDVRRTLEHRPVLARRGSRLYRTRRFLQRNRVSVAAAALVLLALIGGTSVAAWQAAVAGQERDEARRQRLRAVRVAEVLVDLFEGADPARTAGAEPITAKELLDRGADRLAALDEDPDVQAALVGTIAVAQGKLGDHTRALELHTQAVEILQRLHDPPHPELARALTERTEAATRAVGLGQGIDDGRRALAQTRALYGPTDPRTLRAKVALASALRFVKSSRESEELFLEAIAALRAGAPAQLGALAHALASLGELELQRNQAEDARVHFAEAASLFEGIDGLDSLDRAHALEGVAAASILELDYAASERASLQALATYERVLGPDHPGLADTYSNLGLVYAKQADYTRAIPNALRALELVRKAAGPASTASARFESNLGVITMRQGDLDGAQAALTSALHTRAALVGDEHRSTVHIEHSLARVLLHKGELEQAEARARHSVAVVEADAAHGSEVWVAEYRGLLGTILLERGALDEADRHLRAAIEAFDERYPDGHPRLGFVLLPRAELLRATGAPAEAVEVAERALAVRERHVHPLHWHLDEARSVLGACLVDAGRVEEGRALLRASHEALSTRMGPDHFASRAARRRLR